VIEGLRQTFQAWIFRPKIEQGTVVLTQRRIFIIPTKQGFALVFVLALMLLGDINYNLSLGYVLTFLLTMMAVMSMLHAFRNLARLEIRAGRADPVFVGQTAHFRLHFMNHGQSSRHNLRLFKTGKSFWESVDPILCFDAPANHETEIAFPVAARRRGWLEPGRLTLFTEFPLGLFYCWSYIHFETRCIVYPKPIDEAALPAGRSPEGSGPRSVAGDEDFSGLRKYTAGDALPRIAWKAYANERGLQVKQFSNSFGEELWLDYADAPDLGKEDKVARMTRWVLDAQELGLRFGLRLPDGEAPPSNGNAHRDECLRRLALFDLPSSSR
jgi:uncharacterized protein (DUF58 family)